MGWKRVQRDGMKQALHGIMKKRAVHKSKKNYSRKTKHKGKSYV